MADTSMFDFPVDEITDIEPFTVIDETGDGPDIDLTLEDDDNVDFLKTIDLAEDDIVRGAPSQEKVAENKAIEEEGGKTKETVEPVIGAQETLREEIKEERMKEEIEEAPQNEEKQDEIQDGDHQPEEKGDEACFVIDKSGEGENVVEEEHVDYELVEETEVETHPYLYLVETFEIPKEQFNLSTIGACKSIDSTRLFMVSSKGSLIQMLHDLRAAKEIALELKMNEFEFRTVISTISISIKDADYIIDALKLKDSLLLLTEILINPKIVKIVWGANAFLATLQLKLHLYCVNIFDVDKAKKRISEEDKNKSLNIILTTDFKFNRVRPIKANFKIRPLTKEYQTYLRAGSHYLIYLYHEYKNRLIVKDKDLYKRFLEECREDCKRIYHDRETVAFQLVQEELLNHHKCEMDVLKKLYEWRSKVGQKRNMRPDFILHKAGLLYLAQTLPTDDVEILKCSNSPFFAKELEQVKNIIEEARLTHQIRDKKNKPRKPPQNFTREQPKRRAAELHAPQINKQRRIEPQNNSKMKNGSQTSPGKKRNEKFWQMRNNQQQADRLRARSKKNKQNNPPRNIIQSNSSQNFPNLNNTFRPNPFSSSSNSFEEYPSTSGVQASRFDQDLRGNLFSSTQNSVTLNPTNVPSNVTFQNSGRSAASSGGFDRGGFGNNSSFSMPSNPNNQSIMQRSMEIERQAMNIERQAMNQAEKALSMSLSNLKELRNEMMRQPDNRNRFGSNNYKDLSRIDNRIDTLQRRSSQSRGDRDERRRYFK